MLSWPFKRASGSWNFQVLVMTSPMLVDSHAVPGSLLGGPCGTFVQGSRPGVAEPKTAPCALKRTLPLNASVKGPAMTWLVRTYRPLCLNVWRMTLKPLTSTAVCS